MTTDVLFDLHGTSPADLLPYMTTELSELREARRRADVIRAGLGTYIRVHLAIGEAWARRDWHTLGYESWDAYLTAEFGEELGKLRLPSGERLVAVADYREQGMSIRAIAKAVHADAKTVMKDLSETPTPEAVTGRDNKTYTKPARPAKKKPAAAAPPDSPAVPAASERQAATDPPLQERPGPDRPADRDPEKPPAEAVLPAVATTGQPGPEPYVAWRDSFAADLARTRAITLYRTPAEVARCADTELVDQLRHIVAELTEYLSDVEAVLAAD
jgi:hypothetical protein